MNDSGAYEGEMNEIALFEAALRAAVRTQPDPALRATVVPRLAQTARTATLEAETHATRRAGGTARARSRGRFALVARVGIAVALIPLVLAGLAFAGVTVPGPARDAFDSVGITLPNQPSGNDQTAAPKGAGNTGNDVSAAAKSASESTSKGNSAAAHRHALAQRAKARGLAKGHTRGKAIGLTGQTPPGRLVHPSPPADSNAGGSSGGSNSSSTHPTPPPHPFPGSNGRGGGGSH